MLVGCRWPSGGRSDSPAVHSCPWEQVQQRSSEGGDPGGGEGDVEGGGSHPRGSCGQAEAGARACEMPAHHPAAALTPASLRGHSRGAGADSGLSKPNPERRAWAHGRKRSVRSCRQRCESASGWEISSRPRAAAAASSPPPIQGVVPTLATAARTMYFSQKTNESWLALRVSQVGRNQCWLPKWWRRRDRAGTA